MAQLAVSMNWGPLKGATGQAFGRFMDYSEVGLELPKLRSTAMNTSERSSVLA